MTSERWIVAMLVIASGASAQTAVDLTRQGKLGSGTTLPAQCSTGQVFLKTNAPVGTNVFACTAPNVWSQMGLPTAGDGVVVSGNTIGVEDAVVPMYYTGAGAPTITCMTGRDFYVDTNAGALYFCKAAGQWQAAGSGSSGISYDPNDATSFNFVEEFPPSSVSNSYVGTNGWTVTNFVGGCSSVFEKGFSNRPGVLDLQANGSNAGCAVSLDGLFPSLAALTWKAKWSWSSASAYTSSNFVIRIGIGNGANSNTTPTDGVWVKFLQGTDTNWQYELYSGGSLAGAVDSGVAFNADNLYTAQYRGDGSKWYVSLSTNGGALSSEKSICPSGCNLTGTLPTATGGPFATILHTSAIDGGTKRLYVDRFSIQITGLAR